MLKFQSHNGAIAAEEEAVASAEELGFNPTMVRLLRNLPSRQRSSGLAFQSHNGAIAAICSSCFGLSSSQVSIPQWCDCCVSLMLGIFAYTSCFNPTMVRLLPVLEHRFVRATDEFQSHNGAIAALMSV